jgi:protein-disulfide isomerase
MLNLKLCATLAAIILFTALSSPAQTPASATAPSATDAQLLKNTEAFIRTLFAWGPDFAIKLGPLAPSPSPDFYLVPLTVTVHDQTDTGTVFVSKDGKTFLRGEMYDTSLNPYADNLKKIQLTGDPTVGLATAKIMFVVFSDFECPHCRELHETLKTLIPEHPEVRFIFKDYPLTQIHPWAETAAIGARCAFIQEPATYFKLADQIFDNQDVISAENAWDKLNQFAAQAGLDPSTFKSCLASKEAKDAVENNLREGQSLNVNSTPTAFINGRPAPGADKSTLTQYLTYESSTSHQPKSQP